MKKLVMFAALVMLTACPVACVNDPTDSEATCVESDTSTEVCDVDSTDEVVEDSTATDTAE